MSTANQKIEKDGNVYWISRSVVITCPVFKIENGDVYTIIEQRGLHVSAPFKWCVPCGYLDYGETLREACAREVYEETGLITEPANYVFLRFNDDPKGVKQNVHMFFYTEIHSGEIDEGKIDNREVVKLKWIKVGTLKKSFLKKGRIIVDDSEIKKTKWAFSHGKLILECLEDFCKRNNLKFING